MKATDAKTGANVALMRALGSRRVSVEVVKKLMQAPEGAEDTGGHIKAAVCQMPQSGRQDFRALMPIYDLLSEAKSRAGSQTMKAMMI
jgi:hypothetical protein